MAVCSILDEQLSIKEIRAELRKPGNMLIFDGLTKDQSIAVYAVIAKLAEQNFDDITSKGIGSYGLRLVRMDAAGYIKPGLGLSQLSSDFVTIMEDATIFTGKSGIISAQSLLDAPETQREILGIEIKNKLIDAVKAGDITEESTAIDIAVIAASNPSGADTGGDGGDGGDGDAAIITRAIKLLEEKYPDIVPPIIACYEVDTIKTPGINTAKTGLIGSKRIKG